MFNAVFGNKQPSLESANTTEKPARRAHVIILGNEKGGSGKTTTCMHLIVSLLRMGYQVGSMDIDARQRSLTRYVENRKLSVERDKLSLPMPAHVVIQKSPFPMQKEAEMDEAERFLRSLFKLQETNDFVVIDSPGNDTYMSRLAHSFSDTIITPINDSFVDLDVLATVDGGTAKVVKPSIYSEMVWEQKLARAKRDGGSIDWIVMRNRLSTINAKNKLLMLQVMGELARRIGFRVAPGFSERVIFRELFLQGLTVLDILDTNNQVSISHIAARQEVRELLSALKLTKLDAKLEEMQKAEKAKEVAEAEEPLAVSA